MRRASLVLFAAAALLGCPKATKDTADAAPATSTSAAASAASSAEPSGPVTYAGTYEAKSATLYIPSHPDWKSTKQAKDDPSKLVGEGAFTLEVATDGRVTGTIDSGPAAPALVSGLVEGTRLTATVRRKEANDHGLTGSIVGTIEGGQITGSVKLSDATAAVLREGKVAAKKK